MIKKELSVNVVEAAERRVLESFNRNQFILLSFSGGKDSICLADIVVKTMQKYGIAFNRLTVYFFDEETIFPDVEEIVKNWRSKFMSLGAKFYWFCLPIRHYNCCNKLADDENWFCWEQGKENVWCRQMPKFAIRNHVKFKLGMSYQEFAKHAFQKLTQMVGLRMAESLHRRQAVLSIKDIEKSKFCYPIYDWKDNDVWLYIRRYNLDFPISYLYMYKVGTPLNKLRISQFFAMDTIKSLPKVIEYYPELYDKIVRREPNVELAMLYWDTDMFRSSKQDTKFGMTEQRDFKKLFRQEFRKACQNPDEYPGYLVAKIIFMKLHDRLSQKIWATAYRILLTGDMKKRHYRTILNAISNEEKKLLNG